MNIKVGDQIYFKRERAYLYNCADVVAETARSWVVIEPANKWMLCDPMRYGAKLPKSGKGWKQGNEWEVKLAQWALNERYYIGTVVQGQEPNVLLTIARMIGYKTLPNDKETV